MDILFPSSIRPSASHPFADLSYNPSLLRRASRAFVDALARSFAEDEKRMGAAFTARINTESERKRRAAILAKWYRILTGDERYSPQHALDEMGRALRAELDGTPYAPPRANRLWSPPQGDIQ